MANLQRQFTLDPPAAFALQFTFKKVTKGPEISELVMAGAKIHGILRDIAGIEKVELKGQRVLTLPFKWSTRMPKGMMPDFRDCRLKPGAVEQLDVFKDDYDSLDAMISHFVRLGAAHRHAGEGRRVHMYVTLKSGVTRTFQLS